MRAMMITKLKPYAQVLLILLFFALMTTACYLLMSKVERGHLKKETEIILNQIQSSMTKEIAEQETLLDNIAKNIGIMIAQGDNSELINEYVMGVTKSIHETGQFMHSLINIYVIFDDFIYIGDTLANYKETLSSLIENRASDKIAAIEPYYDKTMEIATIEPYYDTTMGLSVVMYSRRVVNNENKRDGVVYLQMKLNGERALKIELAKDGFGILFDNNLKILAHPNKNFYGKKMTEIPFGVFDKEMELGEMNNVKQFINYRGHICLAFLKRINETFTIGVVTPKSEYYKGLNRMLIYLILIGTVFSVVLSIIFVHIIRENEKAKGETRKRIEAELANTAKSAFLAKMSHEIRTPMNVILGVTEIQLQEETLAPHIRESYLMIYNSGNLLLNIINDILDLSKIEAGKMELTLAKYEIVSLVNDTVQLNIMRNKSKNIKFKLLIDENVPLELVGDEIRIKQILNNLLSNAFKYTEAGEVKLSISAEHDAGKGYAMLLFEISDTGQGMTEEQMSKLFVAEYIRFNLEANRTIEGTGLGINITNHLVQMMDGKIFVDSELGKGTKFTVYLPQKKEGDKVLGVELAKNLMNLQVLTSTRSKKEQFTREYMPYGSVLVVDDVETNLHVTKGLMMPYGLSIELVSSGFEALERIKNGKVYDIIFMDHMMPVMDGIETTKKIRELGYTHPIVALTANAIIGQVKIFMDNGFDDFLSKPVDLRQLNNVLNKLIRDKQTPEVIAEARKQKEEKAKYAQISNDKGANLQSIFVNDAKKVLPIFKTVLENTEVSEEDLHLYTVKTHAMKSALANIGEMTLSHIAFMLEKAGKEHKMDVIKQKTQGLIDALESIIEEYESKKQTTDVKEDQDVDFLKKQLKIISEACVNYDANSANTAITNLSKMQWTKETKALLDEIANHLLYSNFEEAAELAKSKSA